MRNNVLNCIAIDDDPSYLKLIREYCSIIPSVNLTATFTNPQDAVHVLNNNQTDLIFLDVVMPQITGPEFLKIPYNPPMVIFISALRNMPQRDLILDAADYIVKPLIRLFLKSSKQGLSADTAKKSSGVRIKIGIPLQTDSLW